MGNSSRKTYTIFVTGFGPFRDEYKINPSFEIVQSLPKTLPVEPISGLTVQLICHQSPVEVSYDEVKRIIPEVLSEQSIPIDMVLHIGMAIEQTYYAIERYAHRDDYDRHKDVHGKVLDADQGARDFGDLPARLCSSFDFLTLIREWQDCTLGSEKGHGRLPRRDLRPSDDAGHFLCDYIYFNSLAWFARQSGVTHDTGTTSRPVMFLHVPVETDEASLETGRTVACGLIQAMAKGLASYKGDIL